MTFLMFQNSFYYDFFNVVYVLLLRKSYLVFIFAEYFKNHIHGTSYNREQKHHAVVYPSTISQLTKSESCTDWWSVRKMKLQG